MGIKHATSAASGTDTGTGIIHKSQWDEDHLVTGLGVAFVGAKAYNSTTQAVTTVFNYDSEDFDTDGFHSTSSNTSRMTIPAGLGGKSLLPANFYNGTAASRDVWFLLNGTTAIRGSYSGSTSSVGTQTTAIVQLAAGDYVEVTTSTTGTYGHASDPKIQSSFSIMCLVGGSGVGGGGLTQAFVGYNTAGGSIETPAVNSKVYFKQFTLTADGLLTSIGAYVQLASASDAFGVVAAVYDDNAGAPDKIIAHSNGGGAQRVYLNSTAPRWIDVPVGKWLVAGTYWMAVRTTDTGASVVMQMAYDAGGSDITLTGGIDWRDYARYSSPTTTSNKYSIRGTVVSGASFGGGGGGSTGARYPLQATASGSASGTTRTATLSAPTAGNILIATTLSEGTGSVSSIVQTNVTWTKLAQSTAGVAPVIEIWKGVVAASPGTSAVATWSDSTFHNIVVQEWSGLVGTLDQNAQNHGTAGGNNIAIITPAVQTALVVTGVSTTSNSTSFSGFTGTPLILAAGSQSLGMYWGFPGMTAVYGAASGGNSNTYSSCTISIT